MNRSRFLLPVVGVCCLASVATLPARAQDLRSIRQSFQASGTLSWGNQSQNVQRVRVELDEDGDARLKFDGQARDGNWGWRDGDWRNWSANQEIDGVWLRDTRGITVDLRTGIGGQTVVGNAHINFEDDFGRPCPRELTLSGRVVRRPWDTLDLSGRLVFDSWGNNAGGAYTGGPFNNRLDEFSTIKRGRGQFLDGDQTNDIFRAEVQLGRNGIAKIVLSGDREYTLGGRWRQIDANCIELRIDSISSQADRRVFDVPRPGAEADFLGGGEIRLDSNRMIALRLSGTRGNRDFDAQFEPQIDNGNGGGGWNGGGWTGGNVGGVWNGNGGVWNGNNGRGDGGDRGNGGGGNWGGGWTGGNGNGNNGGKGGGGRNGNNGGNGGGWNGNGGQGNGNNSGNKTRPEPIPEANPDAWRGWTGQPINGPKGTLPAPPPQGPTQEHTSGPLRRPSQPSPAPESKSAPESKPVPAPAPEQERPRKPDPAPEPERSSKPDSAPEPPAKPERARKPDPTPEPPAKPEEKPEKSSPDESSKEKERPHSRVGRPR